MFPHGTIYDSSQSSSFGVFSLQVSRKVKILFFLLRGLGAGLVGFVVIAFLTTFWPVISSEVGYTVNKNIVDTRPAPIIALEKKIDVKAIAEDQARLQKANQITQVQAEAQSLGVDSHFSLVVPKINAKSNVVANVNTADEKDYTQALKLGVAHAAGSYFPGQNKTIFLFSHSTNSPLNVEAFSAVFYLLRKLETDDRVVVFFADKKYEYQVIEKQIVSPTDVSWITKDFGQEMLILQTCTPPGTSWQRLLVIAKPVTI